MNEDGTGEVNHVENPAPVQSRLKWALQALCLGQLLAFCNALSGIFNQIITSKTKESMPACQTALNYVFICLSYGFYQCSRHGLSSHNSTLGVKCLANAIIDVEAWYWIYKSYNFTSLTSVQSLDCLAIPVVIIISKMFLQKTYNQYQYGAILLSLCGVLLIVYSDYDPDDNTGVKGDIMCSLGAILFGISTVCQEWIIEDVDIYQYMGTVCWYAGSLSIVKVFVLEGDLLVSNLSDHPELSLLMLGLAISQFIFYSAMPLMLRKFGCGAATINILAADLYAAIAGTILFNLEYDLWYLLGMLTTCVGIIIYTLRGDNTETVEISDESSESLMKYTDPTPKKEVYPLSDPTPLESIISSK